MGRIDSELSPAELEVLAILWEGGPFTVREALDRLRERGRKIAYNTVLTFLTRLEQKGYVASDKSGMAYVYRARVSRERVSTSRLRALIRTMYGGAAAPLVLQLMQQERFTPEELAQLQRLIDQLAAQRGETTE